MIGLLALSLVHRVVFDLLSTGGAFCQATPKVMDQSRQMVQQQPTQMVDGQSELDEKLGGATFRTDSMCHATGLRLIAGRKYRIRIDMDAGVDGEWFDKGIRADVAGFSADNVRHYTASPLKRWWRENWFQPIARLGEVGNYEHVLQPVAPLPAIHFTSCRPPAEKPLSGWDAIRTLRRRRAPSSRRLSSSAKHAKGFGRTGCSFPTSLPMRPESSSSTLTTLF